MCLFKGSKDKTEKVTPKSSDKVSSLVQKMASRGRSQSQGCLSKMETQIKVEPQPQAKESPPAASAGQQSREHGLFSNTVHLKLCPGVVVLCTNLLHFDGLALDCSKSSLLAMEFLQYRNKPSNCSPQLTQTFSLGFSFMSPLWQHFARLYYYIYIFSRENFVMISQQHI